MSDENQEVSNANDPELKPWGMEVKQFCMLMHLSQFAGFIIPGAGLVLPIVMWATNKDNHKEVNLHGLVIFNWMISAFIYFFGCFILSFLLIGIPMMLALGIAALVFTILAAIKANEGTYWPYPLSIDFFGVKAKIADAAEE
jgi:uncharacterized Tic20 family protein